MSEPHGRPFDEWLLEHRQGATARDLSDRLRELTTAVMHTAKRGTLTLTITIEPMVKDAPEAGLIVTDKVILKAPEDRGGTVFHADKRGDLRLVKADQLSFDSVVTEAGEVNPATGQIV